jgi:hypothetical protein
MQQVMRDLGSEITEEETKNALEQIIKPKKNLETYE